MSWLEISENKEPMHTWVEIDRSALLHNLKNIRAIIGKATLLIPVIKSNAYGHGIEEVSRICDESDEVDRVAVASLNEALLLRLIGIKKPIQVLSFFELDPQKAAEAIKKNIIFPVYEVSQAKWLHDVGARVGLVAKIHMKVDCGTTRVGFTTDLLPTALKTILKLKNIELEGVWSHFSSSETDDKTTYEQLLTFEMQKKLINSFKFRVPIYHISCSAATFLHSKARFDAVRVGLSTYGLYTDIKSRKIIKLKPVLSWKTRVIQVKNVKKNAKISYGGTYKMQKNGKIAVLPVGYYDGYDRAWSNKAHVLIDGKRCPVRGRICMNLTMIDVTKVKNCKIGTVVTLLGKNGLAEVTADDLTALTPDTINYEIVTKINPLLPRIVV